MHFSFFFPPSPKKREKKDNVSKHIQVCEEVFFFFEKKERVYMLCMYLYKLYWHQGHQSGHIIYTGISIKKKCGRSIPKKVPATWPHWEILKNGPRSGLIDWFRTLCPCILYDSKEEIQEIGRPLRLPVEALSAAFECGAYSTTYIHTYIHNNNNKINEAPSNLTEKTLPNAVIRR